MFVCVCVCVCLCVWVCVKFACVGGRYTHAHYTTQHIHRNARMNCSLRKINSLPNGVALARDDVRGPKQSYNMVYCRRLARGTHRETRMVRSITHFFMRLLTNAYEIRSNIVDY